MKYKTWESFGTKFTFTVNMLDDVLDLNRFRRRSFTDFKTLLKVKREREAKKIAKDVFTAFLKKMSEDLIYENDIFVLPIPSFGYIKVSNTANPRRKDYFFDIESDGKIWTPKIKLNPENLRRTKKHYKVRFNQKLRNEMQVLIESGHKYR
jgi:hypothetical protein